MSFCDRPVRLGVGDQADQKELIMQYLLMIYQNEAEYAKLDPATSKKTLEEYGAFSQSIIQGGNFKAGNRLQPTTTATTVRAPDANTLPTHHPYPEIHT